MEKNHRIKLPNSRMSPKSMKTTSLITKVSDILCPVERLCYMFFHEAMGKQLMNRKKMS